MKKIDKSDVMIVISTFIGAVIAFVLYVQKFIENNMELSKELNRLYETMEVNEGMQKYLLIGIAIFIATVHIIVGFIINKLIFKVIKIKDVDETKLFISTGISYILVFLVGMFLTGVKLGVFGVITLNLLEVVVFVNMEKDELKGKFKGYMLCKLVLICGNIITYFFS